jgi:hypothetical protein
MDPAIAMVALLHVPFPRVLDASITMSPDATVALGGALVLIPGSTACLDVAAVQAAYRTLICSLTV